MSQSSRLALLGLLLLLPGTVTGTPFVAEGVDPPDDVGKLASLALNAQGDPRISYYNDAGDASRRVLKYAEKHGAAWSIETADASMFSGIGGPSLGLDGLGNPRVAYYVYSSDGATTFMVLRFASRGAGGWQISAFDTSRAAAIGDGRVSMRLDQQGNPHVAYYGGPVAYDGDLKYASMGPDSTWTVETVVSSGYVGLHASLDLDSQGRPCIAYYSGSYRQLEFATKQSGSWVTEVVDGGYVGVSASLALSAQGMPSISYWDEINQNLKFASKTATGWSIETVDAASGNVGEATSLVLDAQGNPHIAYYDATNGDLKYAVKTNGAWSIETADAPGTVGANPSLALDGQGNPHVAYGDISNGHLRYASSAVHVTSPAGGEVWPVGSVRNVEWSGVGPVSVSLSSDGGASYQTLIAQTTTSPVALLVPHIPTKFARMKVERPSPYSVSYSESLFTIMTSVTLLALLAAPAPNHLDEAIVTWRTDPGPTDLAGYRLEKASGASGWRTIVALTKESSYTDAAAGSAARYRLFAVNGLGEELMLGETSLRPEAALVAWPLPYRGGTLNVSFATFGGLGGGEGPSVVSVYDVSGRLVRTIAHGSLGAGYHSAAWDGRDGAGRMLASGIYFICAQSGGEERTLKIAVLR